MLRSSSRIVRGVNAGSRALSTLPARLSAAQAKQAYDEGAVFVDCSPLAVFARAHVAGARCNEHLSLKSEFSGGEVVDEFEFARVLGEVGVRGGDGEVVVVYDDSRLTIPSSRFSWCAWYYGLERVHVLEGGFGSWFDAKYPLERGVGSRDSAGPIEPLQPVASRIASVEEVAAAIGDPDIQIVDARTRQEFAGEDARGNARTGHVPGAVNLVMQDLAPLSSAEIAELSRKSGLDPGKRTIVYCQSGARSSVVLSRLRDAGFNDLANFDQSMAVYLNRTDLPVE